MMRKIDKLPSGDKEKMLGNIGDINNIMTELEDRINALKTECPMEWSPQKKEIDDAHVDMRSKYDAAMESIGKAAPVSIPRAGWRTGRSISWRSGNAVNTTLS